MGGMKTWLSSFDPETGLASCYLDIRLYLDPTQPTSSLKVPAISFWIQICKKLLMLFGLAYNPTCNYKSMNLQVTPPPKHCSAVEALAQGLFLQQP